MNQTETKLERRSRLHVMVSNGCSNRCVFCLENTRLRRQATFGDPHRILEEFPDRSAVLFTCGEPTLHPDLVDFVSHARELGYEEIELVTNGRRLAEAAYARHLLEAGLTGLTISVHSHRPEIHNRITGRRSFLQTLAGIQNVGSLRDPRVTDLRINTVICRLNLDDLPTTVRFFASVSPDVINLNFVEPTGRAARRFSALVPRMSEVSAQLRRIERAPASVREVVVTGMPPCVLPARWVRSGNREIIHLWDGASFLELQANRRQLFGPPCRECLSRPTCDGVWEIYARQHGWGEFRARSKLNPDGRTT
jgi:molybdenum cofactor biosynthesis enzyme MoaA